MFENLILLRKKLLLISLAVLLGIPLLLSLTTIFIKPDSNIRTGTVRPTHMPTPTFPVNPINVNNPTGIQQSEEYSQSQKEINQQQAEFLRREALVGQFIKKLPHQGALFSMSYSFDDNEFTVVLNRINVAGANKELDQFLLNNGVVSRTWVRNLRVSER